MRQLRSIWRGEDEQCGTPIARAASTKGRSRRERASARTRLAYQGHQQMARAMPALVEAGPKDRNGHHGQEQRRESLEDSVTRIRGWSSQPPRYPAMAPRGMPTSAAIANDGRRW